ncbi:putative quinol monooxygenase [Streptomyces sp. NBC_01497]|uniref:putative quinol monooxygenase n=1 Tax=Streptomyces sp. NBC_01497 TaxID=2903885 RepID=UPI002E35C919|nr:antibiotic biosynthesis monooxygenase [Streptomyces sp. NBC_01497]
MSASADSTVGHAGHTVQTGRERGQAVPGPDPVCLVTRFTAVDDAAARGLLDELRAIEGSVVAEYGHLTYDVFADQDHPLDLYVIETWAGATDAQRHEDLVLGNGTVQRVMPLLTAPLRTLTLLPVATDSAGATYRPAPVRAQSGSNDKEAEQE